MTSIFKTGVLLAALTALFMGVGYMVGGPVGMGIAFCLAVGLNFFAYWNADSLVLRMHRARPVDEETMPHLVRPTRQMAEYAGLPMPRVYIIDTEQPNAFATGRNPERAAVAVTTGLMKALTPQELAGVIAHELAHVKNRDTLIMTVTAVMAGAIGMLANFALFFGGGNSRTGFIGALALAILGPLAAAMVQMAISRTREYEADRMGALICGRPLWLAAALEKIDVLARRTENRTASASPATAHLFIINPLHGRRADNLFSTHPGTGNRIARLQAMARDAAQGADPTDNWSATN